MRRSRSYSSLQKDYETQSEEEEGDGSSVINAYETDSYSILKWQSANKNRKPLVNFAAASVLVGTPLEAMEVIKKFHLGYKFVKTECRLVRNILSAHGFNEIGANSLHFNLMWTGSHLKPYTLRALTEFQKVNHFPRSYELTRKDRLYKNIQRMQHSKGLRYFDFVPQSFVLSGELNEFYSAFLKDKGLWIVKPVASSRGRGIYLISHPNQIPVQENVLVSRYIDNPLLINGYKFDCRLYVAITCYDPLRLYLYEEGLARFSTAKYEKSSGDLNNIWMHLTNYSVNKTSEDYVRCEDPEVDDYGSKWSFSAMLRCVQESGCDVEALMARIEDVVIKTIISGEMAIATACKMFVPHRGNCFELFGFDILIDENLRPWLLEVNLSPSLACDSPLDLKIKANMITDLFNLTGFVADDPTQKKPPKLITERKKKQRHASAAYSATDLKSLATKSINKQLNDGLTVEERKILRETKEEAKRCGGFIRIYPSPESWELYSSLQEHQTTHNRMIHSKLYPDLWRSSQRPQSATYIARARNFSSISKPIFSQNSQGSLNNIAEKDNFHNRFQQYICKLKSWSDIHSHGAVLEQQHVVANMMPVNNLSVRPSLTQGKLTNPTNYEEKLLEKGVHTSAHADVVKNGQYLSKFQARAAFAVYLQRVQRRLLEEISTPNPKELSSTEQEKQEQQINLIHKFLVKAAVNISSPIEVSIPSKSLPIVERKKILAHQLIDFVQVYKKETGMMMERDGIFTVTENSIDDKSFKRFIENASECELEDALTLFTKYNKSASIFLGTKADKKKEKEQTNNRSSSSVYINNTDNNKTAEPHNRPRAGRPASGSSIKSTDTNGQSTYSGLERREEKKPVRLFSAGPAGSAYSESVDRQKRSRRPRVRSASAIRVENHLNAVCAYTRLSTSSVKQPNSSHAQDRTLNRPSTSKIRPKSSTSSIYSTHVFGVDDPELTKALKKLSLQRSERNYSVRRSSTSSLPDDLASKPITNAKPTSSKRSSKNTSNIFETTGNVNSTNKLTMKKDFGQKDFVQKKLERRDSGQHSKHESDTLEQFIKYGQQFVVENKKDLQVDRNNFLQQTASTQTDTFGCGAREKTSKEHVKIMRRKSDDASRSSSGRNERNSRSVNNNRMMDDVLVNFSEPRPPEKKKPEIKKQMNSQRMKRLVGKR